MTDPSTLLEMDLPDEVVLAAYQANIGAQVRRRTSELSAEEMLECEAAAIRAALQAMVDGGMARIVDEEHSVLNNKWTTRSLRIPLDSPQRKEKEQT